MNNNQSGCKEFGTSSASNTDQEAAAQSGISRCILSVQMSGVDEKQEFVTSISITTEPEPPPDNELVGKVGCPGGDTYIWVSRSGDAALTDIRGMSWSCWSDAAVGSSG